MPTVPGGLAETEVTVSGGSGIFDSQIVLDWAASPAAAVSVDYQQTQIFDVTATPTFDVGTRSVTWSNGTIGNAPSVVDTMISVTRAAGSGSDSSTNWTWQLLGPATDEGSAALPVLPTDVFAWNPIDTDTIGVTELVTAIVPGGYDAVRGILLSSSSLSSIIDGAATGQIVVELADAGGPVAGVARGGAAPRASRTRLAKLWRAASSAARRPAR